jgi:hypothetical protein
MWEARPRWSLNCLAWLLKKGCEEQSRPVSPLQFLATQPARSRLVPFHRRRRMSGLLLKKRIVTLVKHAHPKSRIYTSLVKGNQIWRGMREMVHVDFHPYTSFSLKTVCYYKMFQSVEMVSNLQRKFF